MFVPDLEFTESLCRFTYRRHMNKPSVLSVCLQMTIYQAENLVAGCSPSIQLRQYHCHVFRKHTHTHTHTNTHTHTHKHTHTHTHTHTHKRTHTHTHTHTHKHTHTHTNTHSSVFHIVVYFRFLAAFLKPAASRRDFSNFSLFPVSSSVRCVTHINNLCPPPRIRLAGPVVLLMV